MNFVALDFETANSRRSSVCSLGIAVVENGVIVDEAYWLVKPKELQFDPYNTYIHGISVEDVKNEPEFDELWPKIKPYLENRVVIAHNASFDLSVLRYILDEYKIPYPTLSYSCSWIISKKHWPDLLSHKLNFISEHIGFQFKHHNALEDALACANIVIQICKDSNTNELESLIKKLDISMGELYPGGHKSTNPKSGNFKSKALKPSGNKVDPNHPFYMKSFVFTGTLKSMSRKNAMQKVLDCGGYISDIISTDTNFLVLGSQDFWKFKQFGKSIKLRHAEELLSNGVGILIIGEEEFLGMLKFK
jgi:DNA polymerase III subunit epsilon